MPTFNSKYTDKKVTWRHLIIEKVCENKAALDKELPLPTKFWNIKKWSRYWAYQNKLVKPILEHVQPLSILKALDITKATSLANQRFKKECWKIHKESLVPKQNSIQPTIRSEQSTGQFSKKKTKLDLL